MMEKNTIKEKGKKMDEIRMYTSKNAQLIPCLIYKFGIKKVYSPNVYW